MSDATHYRGELRSIPAGQTPSSFDWIRVTDPRSLRCHHCGEVPGLVYECANGCGTGLAEMPDTSTLRLLAWLGWSLALGSILTLLALNLAGSK